MTRRTPARLAATALALGAALALLPRAARAQDDYERWLRDQDRRYQGYLDEQDKKFLDFLAKEWKLVDAKPTAAADTAPKPRRIPPAIATGPRAPIVVPAKPPLAVPRAGGPRAIGAPRAIVRPLDTAAADGPDAEPGADREASKPDLGARPGVAVGGAGGPGAPTAGPIAGPAGVAPRGKVTRFAFYGAPVSLVGDAPPAALPAGKVDKKAVAGFFEAMGKSAYQPLLQQALESRDAMRLGDFAYSRLLFDTGRSLFGDDRRAYLYTWFMLLKSGYDARIGYSDERVYLMLPSDRTVYSTSALKIGGGARRHYIVALDGGPQPQVPAIYTYDGTYPGADRVVDFAIGRAPKVAGPTADRTLRFTYGGATHAVPVKVNKHLADFLNYYPQVEFDAYFDARPSDEAADALAAGLRPLLRGRPEREQVNLLLRFVQTAFEYKTDGDQFKREKPFFVDETLWYPYSDCEDRSILFSYLVRTLTGLEVIGLDYPGHIATAVRFTTDVQGDVITYDGKRFVVSDPTYIGADVGMTMPQFRGVAPTVIPVR